MLFKTVFLATVAISLLTLLGCNSADNTRASSPANSAIVATVNGIPITASRVEVMVKKRAERGHPANPESRNGLIDQLAMQVILSQEAIKMGLDKDPEVADEVALAQQSTLAKAVVQYYTKNASVTDDMVRAEYEKIKGQMAGTEYKARHILVEKEADAKDIIARLRKNAKLFESLAKERSKDPGSKGNGGDLGWFELRSMAPEFGAALTKLTKGQITYEPVKSQFGYHVILLEDVRQKQFPSLDQIKSSLQQQIRQQNVKKLLDDLKAKAKIEIVDAAAASPSADKDGKSTEKGKQ